MEKDKKTLKAVRDMVIVRLIYADKIKTIIVPDKSKPASASFYGEVVAIGPDNRYDLKIGDKIHYVRSGACPEGFEVKYDGEKLWAIQNKWIWGVEREP